jgi:deoxycytidylate deaminase
MLEFHKEGQQFLHAEVDAIIKAINQWGQDLSGTQLFVLRVTSKGGNVANSKPCAGCQKYIEASGISEIFWTE